MSQPNKTYRYSIYTSTGDYVTDWTDVISDPSFTTLINSGPGELRLRLARPFANFGESVDIVFENELRIYAIDREAPNGQLIYSGRLNEYQPHFGPDGEWLEVQFVGYVTQLDDRLVRDRTAVDFSQGSETGGALGGDQLFTLGKANSSFYQTGATVLNSVAMRFQPSVNSVSGIKVSISGAVSNPQNLVAGLMYADSLNHSSPTSPPDVNANDTYQPGVVIASGVITPVNIPNSKSAVNVNFPASIFNIDLSRQYYAFVSGSGVVVYGTQQGSGSTASPGTPVWAANGDASNRTGFNVAASTNAQILCDLQVSTLFDSSAPNYSQQDPTAIVQDILTNKYSGKITYDAATSQATGLSVTYLFNKQTVKQAIEQMTALSPPYWFWRVNPDNTLTFKRRDDATVDHYLIVGSQVESASPTRSVNETKTRVVFYGGSDVGKPELLYTDDRANMQSRYTLKEDLMRDARVLLSSSADLLTKDFMDEYGNPATQMQIDVIDSNGDLTNGYDIESFRVGQRVQLVDPNQNAYLNIAGSWDNAVWDGDTWDMTDNYLLDTPLQIYRIDYAPDRATLYLASNLSTSKRTIEADRRNLEQSQTANAPAV